MQAGLFIALPILLALSGCSEARDQLTTPTGEIEASDANERTDPKGEAEAPDIEFRDPVGLD